MLDDQTRRILGETFFGVLATINRDGTPQQTVMWYELIDDRIMMNTAAGRLKEANIRRDPRVSVCIEDQYSYITLTGRAELDDDPVRSQTDIARLAHRYHTPEKAGRLTAGFENEQRITIWVDIERVVTKFQR